MSELFGPGGPGEGTTPTSQSERKYGLPLKPLKSESKTQKGATSSGALKKPKFWNRFGSAKKIKILEKFRDDKLFGKTGMSRIERKKYAEETFNKFGTSYGSKRVLKKKIKELKRTVASGKTQMEQSQARKRLRLLEEIFGKDVK